MYVFFTIGIGFVFALVIICFSNIGSLQGEVRALQRRLEELEAHLSPQEHALRVGSIAAPPFESPPADTGGPRAADISVSELLGPAAEIYQEAIPMVERVAATTATIRDSLAAFDTAPSVPRGPSRFRRVVTALRGTEEWETLIGGRWLNRLGAFTLILGIAFFFKYAVDQNWISQGLRVAAGLLVGAGLLIGARRFHGRGLNIFAQGLVGAGTSALYLSIYASYNFYHLIPGSMALAALSVITAVTVMQALYYDSAAVIGLAWLGGMLTPLLLTLEQPDELGLFIYLLLFAGGMLFVVLQRASWRLLAPITMSATYSIYALWYIRAYSEAHLLLTVGLLTGLWILFLSYEVSAVVRSARTAEQWGHALGLLNGLVYYGAAFLLLVPHHRTATTLLTLGVGAGYLAVLFAVYHLDRVPPGMTMRYTLTAIALLVLATAIRTSGFLTVIFWSLEGAAILIYAARSRARLGSEQFWFVWAPALAIFPLAFGRLLLTTDALFAEHPETFRLLLNQRALAYGVLAAALGVASLHTKQLGGRYADVLVRGLQYGWCLVAFLLVTVETNEFFRGRMVAAVGLTVDVHDYTRYLALASVWLLFALPLVYFGMRRRQEPLLSSGLASTTLAFLTVVTAGTAYRPIERFVPVFNLRTAALVLMMVGLAVLGTWFRRSPLDLTWGTRAVTAFDAAVLLAGFALLSGETNDFFRHQLVTAGGLDATSLNYHRFLALAAVWLAYGLFLGWLGLRRRHLTLLQAGAGIVLLATLVALGVGAAYQPIERFLVVFNGRAAVLLFLLASLSLSVYRLRRDPPPYPWTDIVVLALRVVIILVGFELLTAEINDYFRHLGGAVGRQNTGTGLFLEGMILAGVWMMYSVLLVWYGLRRSSVTLVWMGLGSAILGAGVGAVAGIAIVPSESFAVVLGVRATVLPLLMAGLFVHLQFMRRGRQSYAWMERALLAFQAGIVILGFELVTGETRDFYGDLLASPSSTSLSDHLRNLEQLTLSVTWLLYAVGLMAIGLWRRTRWLRIGAMALLGFIVLKIFAYDLSFLAPAYRYISFAGLGVILLGISYLYQRYRGLLLDVAQDDRSIRA